MKALKITLLTAATLAAIAAIMSVPTANRAEAGGGWCPVWMSQYCVLSRDGFEFVAWTKPCFARQEGLHILHPGLCHGIDKRGHRF